MSTTNVEIELRSPTLVDLAKFAGNWEILKESCQDHGGNGVQIHNMYNTTIHDKDNSMHDEYNTSEDENITEIETYEHYGEKNS